MTIRRTILAAAVTAAVARAAPADPPSTQSAGTASFPASTGPLRIVVSAVDGQAQVRPAAGKSWRSINPNEELIEGCSFRTGPQGVVQFRVLPDQVYRVDRVSLVRVVRANLKQDGTIQTDVGIEYGRVSKDVDAPVRPHADTIISPSSTLAVRGTRVSLYDQPPYTPEAVSLTGRAVFDTMGRKAVAFGAKGEGTAKVSSDLPDPAGNALASRIIDPSIANARTAAEQRLLADLITQGAVVTFDNTLRLPVVTGGTVPTDAQLPTLVPGGLTFIIRWDKNTNVDLGLLGPIVSNTDREFVFPFQGLDRTPLGGHILFDHRGGPSGGFEVVTYPTRDFPDGHYTVTATNKGTVGTDVRFNAFIVGPDGKKVPQMFGDSPFQRGNAQPVLPAPAMNSNGAVAIVTKASPNSFYSFSNPFGGFVAAPAQTSDKGSTSQVIAPLPVAPAARAAATAQASRQARVFPMIPPTKR